MIGRAPFMPERQHLHVLIGVGFAGQPRDLLSVGREQHHRRIAAHLEARTQLLRARRVAVDVDRHEEARPLDEVLAVEDRRLDLVARRAPHGAPVEEQRLARRPWLSRTPRRHRPSARRRRARRHPLALRPWRRAARSRRVPRSRGSSSTHRQRRRKRAQARAMGVSLANAARTNDGTEFYARRRGRAAGPLVHALWRFVPCPERRGRAGSRRPPS